MKSIYTIHDVTTRVIKHVLPKGLIAAEGICESEMLMEFRGIKSVAKSILLNGIQIVHRKSVIDQEFTLSVEHNFPFLKMQFEIEGHSDFKSSVRGVPDVIIPGGSHRLFFLPEVKGVLSYPCSRSTIEILLTKDFLLRMFRGDLQCLSKFGLALEKDEPVLLGGRVMPILPAMQHALSDIINCSYSGAIKRFYLETKVAELLLLQIDQAGACRESEYKLKPADIEKLHFVKEYITRNIHDPKSILQLSKISGINDFKLKRGFKALFGCTLFEYLTDVRLNHARTLLNEGRHTVADVAYLTGYKHSQHFAVAFKRKYGINPKFSKGSY